MVLACHPSLKSWGPDVFQDAEAQQGQGIIAIKCTGGPHPKAIDISLISSPQLRSALPPSESQGSLFQNVVGLALQPSDCGTWSGFPGQVQDNTKDSSGSCVVITITITISVSLRAMAGGAELGPLAAARV